MPGGVFEDDSKKRECVKIAMKQMTDQLSGVKFEKYDDVVFVGKSLGTVAAAKYVRDNGINAKQVWYTPVEKSFSYKSENVGAFIGNADPWSDIEVIRKKAKKLGVQLREFKGCDHSLESGVIQLDMMYMSIAVLAMLAFLDGKD